jgi:carbon-monoxide dehydrogenase small subunit
MGSKKAQAKGGRAMTIQFILNGERTEVRINANTRLITVLRGTFQLLGAKTGCLAGACGSCSVIFNGNVIKSCLIPAFRVQGSDIITIEGFSETNAYQDILKGFSAVGLKNCGYCNAGKILTVEALLSKNPQPSKEDILAGFCGIKCRCTEPESLVAGVLAVADIRQRRLYGRVIT